MIEIQVDNVEQIAKHLKDKDFRASLNRTVAKSITMLEGTARRKTPVKTGLLRNSYESLYGDLEGTLRNFRHYAPYVEARRGFLQNTVAEEEPNIQTLFQTSIDSLLKDLQ